MRIVHMQPNAQLHVIHADRNTNALFGAHFSQQLIDTKLLPCLGVWTRSMCIEYKLDVDRPIWLANRFESSSSVDRP